MIPTTCPTPQWKPGDTPPTAARCYNRLAEVAPDIVPAEAADIARHCAHLERLRPKPAAEADAALAEWLRDGMAAAAAGADTLPDWSAVAVATASDSVAQRIAGAWRTGWLDRLARLRGVLAAHGDDIARGLDALYTPTLDDLRTHLATLAGYQTETAILDRGDDQALAAYRGARAALLRFERLTAARHELHKVTGYNDPGLPAAWTTCCNPGALARLRDLRRTDDALTRWRVAAEAYTEAMPKVSTLAEAQALKLAADREDIA